MISCYPWPSPIWAVRPWVIPCLKGGLSQQNQRTKETNSWLLNLKGWASGFRQKRFGRIFDQFEPIFYCPRKIKIPLAGRQEALLRQSKRAGCWWVPESTSCTLLLPRSTGWPLAWMWIFQVLRTRRPVPSFQVRIQKMANVRESPSTQHCAREAVGHI